MAGSVVRSGGSMVCSWHGARPRFAMGKILRNSASSPSVRILSHSPFGACRLTSLLMASAWVADFGIARAIGDTQAQGLTGTGMAMGTPAYMSPEQWSGDSDVDGRSDIYSLGCLLFEMLEGSSPFGGGSIHRVMAGHAAGEVPQVGSGRSDVPPYLNAVIQKCMAKEPAHRYQDGEELIRDLDEGVGPTQLEVALRKTGQVIRRRPWSRALATVGLAAIVYLTWSVLRPAGTVLGALSDDVVAVFPFNVSGAGADQALGATVANLLSQRLPGDYGLRALAPTEATAALRLVGGGNGVTDEQGLAGARELGAAEVVVGQISVTGSSLNIAARLLDVVDGSELSQAVSVQGDGDELASLADELTVR